VGTGLLLIVCALGLLAGLWLLGRIAPPSGTGDLSSVAIVVPARNEEPSLPLLLESLKDQWPAELVVVDDHSTDGTAQVARASGAVVVPADDLPDGWTGKSWACWTGARATTSAVIVFVDADVRLRPQGLAKVVGELERRPGAIVGVQPFHTMERPYERLAAFFNVVGMMGTDGFTPLGDRLRPTATFGPCLATRRDDYLATGGHEAVKGEVLEDAALARRYPQVAALGGKGVVDFRMYPEGPKQLIEGFSKNFGQGAAGTRPATLALVFLWVAGALLATRHPVAYGLYVVELAWMLRRIGNFGPLTALAYPIPLAFFLAVFLRSLGLTYIRKEVRWRGRTISTR
jgi:4,4'-diaponeurosporenoate glycosyltransferase